MKCECFGQKTKMYLMSVFVILFFYFSFFIFIFLILLCKIQNTFFKPRELFICDTAHLTRVQNFMSISKYMADARYTCRS